MDGGSESERERVRERNYMHACGWMQVRAGMSALKK
jgi:hypothetical protein